MYRSPTPLLPSAALCLWSCCCFPCAAGDVAAHTGGNYCSSCCLVGWGLFGAFPTFGITTGFAIAHRCRDRKATAKQTGVDDNEAGLIQCCKIVCCACCQVQQELREIAQQSTGASKDMDGEAISLLSMRVTSARFALSCALARTHCPLLASTCSLQDNCVPCARRKGRR